MNKSTKNLRDSRDKKDRDVPASSAVLQPFALLRPLSGSFFIQHLQPLRVWASSFFRLRDHTQGRTTGGRTPLDEWSARRRDLHLTTHNTYNRQTPMPPVGFKPAIAASDRPQTLALDRSATGVGFRQVYTRKFWMDSHLQLYNTLSSSHRTLNGSR